MFLWCVLLVRDRKITENYNGPVSPESGEKSRIVLKLFLTSPEEVIQYVYHLFLSVPHIISTLAGATYSQPQASFFFFFPRGNRQLSFKTADQCATDSKLPISSGKFVENYEYTLKPF